MRKIAVCLFVFAGLVTAQAQDMDAMKYFNLGISSSITPQKIKYFSEALRLDPVLADAYKKRGMLYYFSEKYDKVIQDFQTIDKVYFVIGIILRLIGVCLLRLISHF